MKWLADENFDNDILRGVRRRASHVDFLRVQDVGLSGADDPTVLEWATQQGRVLLTHDLSTMIPALREQLQRASYCAPILFVPDFVATALAIADILLLDEYSTPEDWAAGVLYLPLR